MCMYNSSGLHKICRIYLLFFSFSKGGKLQKRGKINLIGRLQLTTEKTKEEDNESIVALRVLRTQVCSDLHSIYQFHMSLYIRTRPCYLHNWLFKPGCGVEPGVGG